jgi:Heterokaryon incompatibility protein (HET)
MRPYQYRSLEADEIRLLKLQGGDIDAELEGNLLIYRLPEDEEPLHGHEVLLTRDGGIDVQKAPKYQALSYTWGEEARSRPLLKVLEEDTFYHLPIKPNLDDALRRFRKDIPSDQAQMFWIDAVCINQEDILEKNKQIRKMAMIYNRADSVSVWLGKEDKDSAQAIEFIERLLKLDNFDPLDSDPGTPDQWAALLNLMQRRWFNRRWIVQEIALARRATVFCGDQSVSWQDFSSAVALFVSRYQDLRQLFQSSKAYRHQPDYLGEVDALGAKALVDITNNLFRKSEDGIVLERLLSLEGLMSTLTAFEASVPHDTIYAVLWLAHDAEPDSKEFAAMSQDALIRTPKESPSIDPVPSPDEISPSRSDNELAHSSQHVTAQRSVPRKGSDYFSLVANESSSRPHTEEAFLKPPHGPTKSFSGRSATDRSLRVAEKQFEDDPEPIIVDYKKEFYEVCREYLEFAMMRSRSLDTLCHPWAPEPPNNEPELPSWISRLSGAPFDKRPGHNSYGRVQADPLVGSPGSGSRNYNASGKTKIYPSRGFINGRTLIVTGFALDAIGVMKSPAYEGIIPPTWQDLVGWPGPPDPVPDRFWRTLVADRGPGGQKQPPAYFPLACKWVFEQKSRRASLNTKELLAFGKCPSIATEFLCRVQSAVWGRKLVLSEGRRGSKPLLALVPENSEKGDLICILYGCSVPVLLRRLKKRNTEGYLSRESSRDETASPMVQKENTYTLPHVTTAPALGKNTTLVGIDTRASKSATDLTVPIEHADPAFASTGVRKALRKDAPDQNPPNLTISPDSQHQYSFIGECYVHGMMAGEGFKHQREHGNRLKVFHLV